MGVRIYLSVRLDQFNTLNLHSRFLSRGVLTLNVYYKYIGEKPLTPFVWLYVPFLLYLGIIKKHKYERIKKDFG
jgi:hypothetical protein